MRPTLAIIVCVTILGGLQLYMQHRQRVRIAPPIVVEDFSEATYSLQLTLTFQAERDSFAFEEDPIILLRFRGEDLLAVHNPVPAGTILRVEKIDHVVVAEENKKHANEIYYEVLTGETEPSVARCVRLQLFCDGELLEEESAWSAPGEPVRGTFRFVGLSNSLVGDE